MNYLNIQNHQMEGREEKEKRIVYPFSLSSYNFLPAAISVVLKKKVSTGWSEVEVEL